MKYLYTTINTYDAERSIFFCNDLNFKKTLRVINEK